MDRETEMAIELAAHKAAPLYRLFGWTWDGIPTVAEIATTLRQLTEEAAETMKAENLPFIQVGTGRLRAQISEDGLLFSLDLEEVSHSPVLDDIDNDPW